MRTAMQMKSQEYFAAAWVYTRTVAELQWEFPTFNVVDHALLKGVSTTIPFPGFGYRVYMDKALVDSLPGAEVLRHERVHMRDARRLTRILFCLIYLFLPLPVLFTFRSWFEYRGYAESIRTKVELHGACGDYSIELMVQQFSSWRYGWMAPWAAGILRRRFRTIRDAAMIEFGCVSER